MLKRMTVTLLYLFLSLLSFLSSPSSLTKVLLGNSLLRENNFNLLNNHRIGILSNPTGVFDDTLEHIVDTIHDYQRLHASSPPFELVAIFSPEHGFRGEKQAETSDPPFYIDIYTKLPVISAYLLSTENITSVIDDLNLTMIITDIQDVGVRLYTFIWTMYKVMQSAANSNNRNDIQFVVCDRPNPLGGDLVDGPILDTSCCQSGYGMSPIPHIHGMTIGELSALMNSNASTSDGFISPPLQNLVVLPMRNYQRSMRWPETGLAWVPPSPNIPTPNTALSYASSVFFEATTISEGRGTTTPFQLFGAPFLDAPTLAKALNQVYRNMSSSSFTLSDNGPMNAIPSFRAAYYEPIFSKYNNSVVSGVQWVDDRLQPTFMVALQMLIVTKQLSPDGAFQWDGVWFGHPGTELIDEYMGTPHVREMIDDGANAQDIYDTCVRNDLKNFLAFRDEFLIGDYL